MVDIYTYILPELPPAKLSPNARLHYMAQANEVTKAKNRYPVLFALHRQMISNLEH